MIPTLNFRHKLLLFAFLNLADLLLTWQLWHRGGGQLLDEAHPIAYQCLAFYGWIGFVGFQFVVSLLVGALFTIGCRFRPRISEEGLSFLCLALSSVVVYRCCLAGMPPPQDQPATFDPSEDVMSTAYLESYQSQHYRQLLHHWAHEVVCQGCTLSEATRQLQAWFKKRLFRVTVRTLSGPVGESAGGEQRPLA